jgi:hypothetical protein
MKRRPQNRCKCGHAKSRHNFRGFFNPELAMCSFCYDKCIKFEQDNLKTLEVLDAFHEQKKIASGVSL